MQDLDSLPFTSIGPQLESHPAFPARCNAQFVQVGLRNLFLIMHSPVLLDDTAEKERA